MARLTLNRFRDVRGNFPEFEKLLKKHIFLNYRGTRKMFIYKVLLQINYMKTISYEAFHNVFMYKSIPVFLNKGDILYREGDEAKEFYVVEYGCLELFTEFEGNEFILERLPTGSILNHRTVWNEDNMKINIRAHVATYIIKFPSSMFTMVKDADANFHKSLLMYENSLIRNNKNFPLDYIICKFNEFRPQRHMLARRNILKNLVFNIIGQIRYRKRMPKLTDLLDAFKGKSREWCAKKME
jgi:hypothetical protein